MRINKKGFTLIESVIVITVMAIIAASFSLYLGESLNAWQFLSKQKPLGMSGKSAIYRIVREIKMMKSPADLTVHTSTEVNFVNISDEARTIAQSGNNLLLDGNIMLNTLANPGGLTLTYLDQNGNVTNVAGSMRVIKIRLTMIQGTKNKYVTESAAAIRNN